jgi:hypothetical protein
VVDSRPEDVVGRKATTTDWPTFDDPLLSDVAAAFLRRRKALGYHAALCCRREFAEEAQGTSERLDFTCRSVLGVIIQLSVWVGGCLRVAVHIQGKGRNSG